MRTYLAALILLAACSKKPEPSDEPPAKAEPAAKTESTEKPEPPPPPPEKKKAKTPEELGTCQLKATGAVTAEQTSPGGPSATNVSYWRSEDERKAMMGGDGFAVNCTGPDIQFSMVPGATGKEGMPYKPKKYEIKKAAKSNDATILLRFGKTAVPVVTGVVDITAFDGKHIAGTIDLAGKTVPGNAEVKLTGTFDLGCPGFSLCE